jgi:hypothetical protein
VTMVTISAEDPRTIKALEIATDAPHWIKCRTRDAVRGAIPVEARRLPPD